LEGINIGLDTSFLGHIVLENLKESLDEMGITYNLIDIKSCNLDSLESEPIDLALLPLSDIPFAQEGDSWTIAGFIQRQSTQYFCYLYNSYPSLFGVKPNGKIAIDHLHITDQISSLRDDLDIEEMNPTLALSQLKEQKIDAFITQEAIDDASLRKIPLATKDIVPKTSSGLFALISTRVNINARKTAQLIHNEDAGYMSNIERTLALKLNPEYHIHCDQDRAGNYHLNIYKENPKEIPHRVQISQSTFVGLAERALTELKI